MSTEERYALTGRIVSERAEARRELSLLAHKIQQIAAATKKLAEEASLYNIPDHAAGAIRAASQFSDVGGIQELVKAITDYANTKERIDSLTQKLKDAGVE